MPDDFGDRPGRVGDSAAVQRVFDQLPLTVCALADPSCGSWRLPPPTAPTPVATT
jgi:hypothetical protein